MYIQKLKVILTSITALGLFISNAQMNNGIESGRSRGNDHKFGIGVNYSYPAPGVSARIGINDNFKVQASYSFKGYDYYNWSVLGIEANYIFTQSNTSIGQIDPFIYAGFGRGTLKWTDPMIQKIITENYHWNGWNIGGGAEWFPEILDEKLGIIAKLGFGSYGTYGLNTSVATGLIYGGGIHYYFN